MPTRSQSAVSRADITATYMPAWAPLKSPPRRMSSCRRWTSSGLLADEMPLGDVLHDVVRAVDAVDRLRAAVDPLVRLDLHEQAVLAADEAAPDAGDPERRTGSTTAASSPPPRRGPRAGSRGRPRRRRPRHPPSRTNGATVVPPWRAPYQVRSLSSSWICSRGTGSLSMWSFSHFEKSFSMSSLQRWSIWPGV